MSYRCPIDGTPMRAHGRADLLACDRGHGATMRGLEAIHAGTPCQPSDWPWRAPAPLTREVLPVCRRSMLGRITIGFCMLVVSGCLLGALAQRLERADHENALRRGSER